MRKKLKKSVYLVLFIIILIGGFFIYRSFSNNNKKYYSDEAIKVIEEENLSDIYKEDYSGNSRIFYKEARGIYNQRLSESAGRYEGRID